MLNIMIHHLHGNGFDPVKGSVHIDDLEKVIDKYGDTARYTFDDRLLSQQLAVELLDKKGIRGWFFVCHHNVMEQDRMTRERTPDFYRWLAGQIGVNAISDMPSDFLSEFKFYTLNDRIYRYFRDIQNPKLHESIMSPLRQPIELLPLSKIKHHNIGMHSYSHPNNMDTMSNMEQMNEWWYCFDWLYHMNGIDIASASYPMGRYNDCTLDQMYVYDIKLGFTSSEVAGESDLELPRTDIKKLIWK